MITRFTNRSQAGKLLAARLANYSGRSGTLVLALPRGGVPVAFEVAREIHAPLDVLVVRKLGVPGHEEMAMGAIATGGVKLFNQRLIAGLGIPSESVAHVERAEQKELARREQLFRGDLPAPQVEGKTVILVDDGIATGATMQAAMASLRQLKVGHLVVAAPVAPASVVAALRGSADEVICVLVPEDFGGVGFWYDDFSQTSDAEVRNLLELAARTMFSPS